ncbi:MAG TPA: hypothetical protein VID07_03000, partial [Actinomycetes bacterium]
MADSDLAGQAEDARPLDDEVEGEGAELTAVVEVDVEPAAVPVGDGEDGVQVLDRPVVEAGRVKAPDQVGALPGGRLQQLGGAGADQQATLGEGDQLNGDPVGEGGPGLHDPVQAVQAGNRVDVDMAADVA